VGYQLGLILAAAGACTACIPVPFVLPPIKAESQVVQPMVLATQSANARELVDATASYRLGIFPMGLVPSAIGRRFDIGGGLMFAEPPLSVRWAPEDDHATVTFREAHQAGGFVEGHYWLKVLHAKDGDTAQRLGLVFDAHYLEAPLGQENTEPGFGASVGVEFETAILTAFAFEGTTSEAAFVGVASGELGYSVGAKVSYHHLGPTDYWSAAVTCSVRFPASAGILFLPIPLD